jgi:general secretion pathway protein L
MAVQVHLHINTTSPDAETLVSWLRLQDGKAVGGIKQGSLSQAVEDIGQDPLLVYIPSRDILLTKVTLPAGRRAQLLTALPYVMEDNLLDSIDSMHCALGSRNADHQYPVAVIKKEFLQTYLDCLTEAGLAPRSLQPDIFLLPLNNNAWSLLCENNQLLFRHEVSAGFACPIESIDVLLSNLLRDNEETPPAHIDNWQCDGEQSERLATLAGDIELRAHELPPAADTGLNLLRQYGYSGTAVNLLQGSYAPGSRVKQYLKPWIASAALLVIWFALGLISDISEYYSLSNQNDYLNKQITQTFRQTFPEIKRVVNPQSQMKSRLRQLRGGSSSSGTPFSEMLAAVSPITSKMDKLTIHHLTYNPGKLDLTFELPSMQSIESLKEQLKKNTPYKIEIKSANASEKNVRGRMVIKGRSS